jgi:hypothetical protein
MLHVPYATKQANSAVCFIAFLFRGRVSVGHSRSTRVWYPPALQRDLPIVCHCMCSKEKATIVKETPTGNSPVPQPHARHCKAAYTALFFDLTPKPSIAQACPQHESYPALAQPPRPSHHLYACTVHTRKTCQRQGHALLAQPSTQLAHERSRRRTVPLAFSARPRVAPARLGMLNVQQPPPTASGQRSGSPRLLRCRYRGPNEGCPFGKARCARRVRRLTPPGR